MNNPQDPLQNREKYIGASDAPAIMGVSKWTTRYELFLQKIGLGKPNIGNYATERGINLEDEARNEFERLTGHTMFPKVVYTKECEFVRASLDGITLEGDEILEIKCPGKEDHDKAMSGIVPEKYVPQLQHQLFVTGLDMVNYFSYTPTSSTIIEVKRDQNYIDHMFKEHCKFWECVQTMEPPELTERDYVTKTDDFWLEVEKKWVLTRCELKELERREKDLRETLISMCGDSNSKGRLIQLTKCLRKGSVDYSVIPQIENMNLDMFRKAPTEYWKIGDVK